MTDIAAPVAFGPYLLVRASGALGRLEMAVRTDVRDPEVCVLKRLPIRALAADAAARFRRQAQLAARLEHENVARTLRVETIEGQVCVARELIDGMTLSKVMRALGAQPAPLIATLHVVHQMARGLAYAHDMSIVHGEVAPENVMIAFSGQVKLIDFGIGRPAGDAEPAQTGVVVGHRGFLPPEAAELPEPDRAGDIYGLGVVLWELLTGHRADDAQELPLPDVRTLNPDVPDELARIVARATALAPQDRPGGADELGAALTTFLPASTDPQQATAALLRSCFDVDTLQPLLAADLAAAKRLVTGEPSETETPPRATPPMRLSAPRPAPLAASATSVPIPRRDRGPLLTLAVALAVAGAGIALLHHHGESASQSTDAVAVAAPAPSPPVAVVASPPAPPVPRAAPVSVPAQPPPATGAETPRASRRGPEGLSRAARDDGAERLLRQANDLFE
ncbi:MAG TPA: serine/threonine-protein kinase, partial [Polyangia bacterium]|nr:serine/threonine-protein kinase [Polyangia bacterium]